MRHAKRLYPSRTRPAPRTRPVSFLDLLKPPAPVPSLCNQTMAFEHLAHRAYSERRLGSKVGQKHLLDLLRPPGRVQPLLGTDQPFDLVVRPASRRLGGAAAILKRLHHAPGIACKPLMARLTRDPELPAKLCHRKMTAPRRTHKLLFLFD
jgi:hypothetical protein